MKKNRLFYTGLIILIFSPVIFDACSKSSSPAKVTDPCAGITVAVTLTPTAADAGASNGSIVASATGGSGFTFSLNNGTFQSSGTFSNLAAGSYKIIAKNANGCSDSLNTTIVSKAVACAGQNPGTLFTAVKTIVTTNCAVTGCHNGTQAPDYRVDCTIVDYAQLIKTRAVDDAGTADQMPQSPRAPLAQADCDKITAWINAGAQITN